MDKKPKRPRDPNQLAKAVVDIATGETMEPVESAAAKRGRLGGRKGGAARAALLTPDQRSEAAKLAAHARLRRKKD